MQSKDSVSTINSLCSKEQLESFINKVCIWNLSFMKGPIVGQLIEINDKGFVLEMRDGRLLVARLDTVVGFGMVKNQPAEVV